MLKLLPTYVKFKKIVVTSRRASMRDEVLQNMNKALSRQMHYYLYRPKQSYNFKLNKQTKQNKETRLTQKTNSIETIHYTVSRRNNYSKTTKP